MGFFFRGELKTPVPFQFHRGFDICSLLRVTLGGWAYAEHRNEYNAGEGQEEVA
jgi:hypothetical protein